MKYAIIITAAILFIVGCVCLYLHIWGDSKPLEKNSQAAKFIALKRIWICLLIVAIVIFTIYCLCPYYEGERWYITWTILAIISLVTILSTSLLLIAEFIVAIVKRQYGTTATLAFWGTLFFITLPIYTMFVAIGVGSCDHFGNRHPIPPNIEYEIPTSNAYSNSNLVHPMNDGFVCYQDTAAITLDVDSIPTFHIYEKGFPGSYIYIATLQNSPSGTLYLKAYEVSSDINIEPLNSEYQIVSFMGIQSFCKGFKIETGSWGEPYAARIELWFSPAEENSEDIKLTEKVYQVEGWSR